MIRGALDRYDQRPQRPEPDAVPSTDRTFQRFARHPHFIAARGNAFLEPAKDQHRDVSRVVFMHGLGEVRRIVRKLRAGGIARRIKESFSDLKASPGAGLQEERLCLAANRLRPEA